MDEDEICLGKPRLSAIWFEKLSQKGNYFCIYYRNFSDQSLPESKCQLNYESVAVSPSGRLVIFQFYGQLIVIDTLFGFPFKLRTVNLSYDVGVSYQFFALSDEEAVVFRKHDNTDIVELEAAKFKMNFGNGE
jgi:hypothetical protein